MAERLDDGRAQEILRRAQEAQGESAGADGSEKGSPPMNFATPAQGLDRLGREADRMQKGWGKSEGGTDLADRTEAGPAPVKQEQRESSDAEAELETALAQITLCSNIESAQAIAKAYNRQFGPSDEGVAVQRFVMTPERAGDYTVSVYRYSKGHIGVHVDMAESGEYRPPENVSSEASAASASGTGAVKERKYAHGERKEVENFLRAELSQLPNEAALQRKIAAIKKERGVDAQFPVNLQELPAFAIHLQDGTDFEIRASLDSISGKLVVEAVPLDGLGGRPIGEADTEMYVKSRTQLSGGG
jgi:hypothetical protein